MKVPRVLTALMGIALLVAAIGCSTTPAEVAPTPNIDATVEARVAHERAIDATVEARAKELVDSQPTATPYPTYTPAPAATPTPLSTPKPTLIPTATLTPVPTLAPTLIPTATPTTVLTPTPTPIPTVTPTPTPTPTPAPTPTPTPTIVANPTPSPVPKPTRPRVNGYLLSVNGEYVAAGQIIIPVPNGEVRVYPVPNPDGGYNRGSTVTLGAYPKKASNKAAWGGVDTGQDIMATVKMDRDRDVVVVMGRTATLPTPTPATSVPLPSHASPTVESPPTIFVNTIPAEQLIGEFQNDIIKSMEKYDGHVLTVSGKINGQGSFGVAPNERAFIRVAHYEREIQNTTEVSIWCMVDRSLDAREHLSMYGRLLPGDLMWGRTLVTAKGLFTKSDIGYNSAGTQLAKRFEGRAYNTGLVILDSCSLTFVPSPLIIENSTVIQRGGDEGRYNAFVEVTNPTFDWYKFDLKQRIISSDGYDTESGGPGTKLIRPNSYFHWLNGNDALEFYVDEAPSNWMKYPAPDYRQIENGVVFNLDLREDGSAPGIVNISSVTLQSVFALCDSPYVTPWLHDRLDGKPAIDTFLRYSELSWSDIGPGIKKLANENPNSEIQYDTCDFYIK